MSDSREWIADIYCSGKRIRFLGQAPQDECIFSVSPLLEHSETQARVDAHLRGRFVEYVDAEPPITPAAP